MENPNLPPETSSQEQPQESTTPEEKIPEIPASAITPAVIHEETPGPQATLTEQPLETKPGFFKRAMNWLFGADSKVGRVFRPFLRGFAWAVSLFAFGLLAGYLLLYRPVQQSLDKTNLDLQTANQKWIQAEKTILGWQTDYANLSKQNQKLQEDYKKLQSNNVLLNARLKIAKAQAALTGKDGATTSQALIDLRTYLDKLVPVVKVNSPDMANQIEFRFNAIQKEYIMDTQNALADLELLDNSLQSVAKTMFGG